MTSAVTSQQLRETIANTRCDGEMTRLSRLEIIIIIIIILFAQSTSVMYSNAI